MHYIDTTQEATEEVLVAIGRHVPAGFELGRPLISTADGRILCSYGAETSLWGLDDGGCRAYRQTDLVRGLVELAFFEYGEQTERRIIRRPGDGGGGGRGGDDGPDEPQPYTGPPGGADDPEFAELVPVRVVHGDAAG